MIKKNDTELVKKYVKEIENGKLYKGLSNKSVIWMQKEGEKFIAYRFIRLKNSNIDKENPEYKKYCISDNKEELECYKIESPYKDVIISEAQNLEKNKTYGITGKPEVLIEYPVDSKVAIDFGKIPREITESLNEWVYNLQTIGLVEHFSKENVRKI